MKLGEFLNHIKHKSLKIEIIDRDIKFDGTIGEYSTSVVKSEINDVLISDIIPSYSEDDKLIIIIDCKGE